MPQKLEDCKSSLLAKWKADPKSRPKATKKGQKPDSQAYAICTASLKKEGALSDEEYAVALTESGDGDIVGRISMLEDSGHDTDEAITLAVSERLAGRAKSDGFGAVLRGVALTIIPFVKRQERASIVDLGDEKKEMRIPILRKSMWRHPVYGILKFDDQFFDGLTRSFDENVYGQDIPVKDAHTPREQHALGWVSRLSVEGEQLVAYAPPTDNRGIDIIENRKAPYASAELVFNYRDSEMSLSLSDCEQVDGDNDGVYEFSENELKYIDVAKPGCADCSEEDEMPEDTNKGVQLSDKEWGEITAKLEEFKELKDTVKTMVETVQERDERILELEQVNEAARIEGIVDAARSYHDADGRTHSAVFLNTLEAALTFGNISEEEKVVVSLSDEVTPETVRDYFVATLRYLSEHLPGSVPADVGTEGDDNRNLEAPDEDENLGADMWDGVQSVTPDEEGDK